MRRRGMLGVLAAACVTGAVGFSVAGPAGTASATTNCWFNDSRAPRPDFAMCHNVVGTKVYGGIGPRNSTDGVVYPNQVVGHLYSNPSWFECRLENGPWNGGGPHPYRWLYTESDDGGWGWVPDTAIYDETDHVLGCGEFA